MSFSSFNGAASAPDFGMGVSSGASSGGNMGQPLSRMHSLDPNSYPPVWSASAHHVGAGAAGGSDGIANSFVHKFANANSVPLLENTPHSEKSAVARSAPEVALTGLKRGADEAMGADGKKVKSEGAPLSRLPSIKEENTDLGNPLGKLCITHHHFICRFFSANFLLILLQKNLRIPFLAELYQICCAIVMM